MGDLRAAPSTIRSLAFSPDGRLLAAACDAWGWLSDPTTGEHVRRLGDSGAEAVAFHPGGSLVATAHGSGRTDADVRLWRPTTGRRVRDLDTAADAVVFSPLRLWNLT